MLPESAVNTQSAKQIHSMKTVDITTVLTGAQLLVSMVETRRASNAMAMDGNGNAPQELEQIEQQLGKLESLDGQSDEVRKEIDDLRERVTIASQGDVTPRSLDQNRTGTPSAASLLPRLRRKDLHRLQRDSWRPPFRRRSRHGLRHGAFSRRGSSGPRNPKGPRHEAEGLSQLRAAESRRLSQGVARDAELRKSFRGRFLRLWM